MVISGRGSATARGMQKRVPSAPSWDRACDIGTFETSTNATTSNATVDILPHIFRRGFLFGACSA
jgi:hypothetical protein